MTFLTSCFNKFAALCLVLGLLTTTAFAQQTPATAPAEGPTEVRVSVPQADISAPQMATAGAVLWSVTADGGRGALNYSFELSRNQGSPQTVQSGSSPSWSWQPDRAGEYRVRVTVSDAQGNQTTGDWSQPFRIEPSLQVEPPTTAQSSPQAAQTVGISWAVKASGGVGDKEYSFELSRNQGSPQTVQSGSDPNWTWQPDRAGDYRVRVKVSDAQGNQTTGDWSQSFRIEPPLRVEPASAAPSSPQAAGTVSVTWSAKASGGVGTKSYSFELWRNQSAVEVVQSGSDSTWVWQPEQTGDYLLRVKVSDALGNEATSDWSKVFHIEPPLAITSIQPALAAPQAAQTVAIPWTVQASGGIGAREYRFALARTGEAMQTMQRGPDSTWAWRPEQAGNYVLKVTVSDSLGNSVSQEVAEPFRIEPPLQVEVPTPDRPSPQAALTEPVTWSTRTSGGVGARSVAFELTSSDSSGWRVQSGAESSWTWYASVAGDYRVRAIVSDSLGNEKASAWSDVFRMEPPLQVNAPQPETAGPQMLGTITTPWTVAASGGVGPLTYEFAWRRNGAEAIIAQSGPASSWTWIPEQPGQYQMQVTVSDSLGNRATSSWSEPYLVAPPLAIKTPKADLSAPQAAKTVPITWAVEASGGVEPRAYLFELSRNDGEPQDVSQGASPTWSWQPEEAGDYRLRVTAIDAVGNRKESDWSEPFRIEPPLQIESLTTDLASPQTAGTTPVVWSATASGGVGGLNYRFELTHNDEEPRQVSSGKENVWTWQPKEEGDYRLRLTITDTLGNRIVGPWSEPYRIEPPLQITSLAADHSSPQAAQTVPIIWHVAASGGVAPLTYAFEVARNDEEPRHIQTGPEADWTWQPEEEGNYRVRVAINDALGNPLQGDWSATFRIEPPLVVGLPTPDNQAEQYLIHSRIDWSVSASGGVGQKTYAFILEQKDGETQTVQKDTASDWRWQPDTLGNFRLRVLVSDALGNQKQTPWSPWKEVVPPLTFGSLTFATAGPQPALRQPIRWNTVTTGGLGTTTYEFRSLKDGKEMLEQKGDSPVLDWTPRKPGTYRIKVIARDAEDNTVQSDWSAEYQITPAISHDTLIAILPVENLSSVKAPLKELGEALEEGLRKRGYRLLPADVLEKFMKAHRMRYTGGIGSDMATALLKETGAEAVLTTSLESFQEAKPPKIALSCRVVLCGEVPEIVWMDSVGRTGDDSPGLLSLGLINDQKRLTDEALQPVLDSLDNYLAGKPQPPVEVDSKFRPKEDFRVADFDPDRHYSVAVVPFLNKYARKNAGFVVPLAFVKILNQYENLRVIEPGRVREQLLKYRLIMPAGPSLAVSDILASPTYLAADLVFSGHVFDYQDLWGTAKVDISTQMFNGPQRKVVWWSRSSAAGDDGVFFFDVGRILSTHNLLDGMAASICSRMLADEWP